MQEIYRVHFLESCAADLDVDLETFDRRREVEVMALTGFTSGGSFDTTLRFIWVPRIHRAHEDLVDPQDCKGVAVQRSCAGNRQAGWKIPKPVRTTLCFAERETSP